MKRKWVYKNKETKLIKVNELNDYLKNNWVLCSRDLILLKNYKDLENFLTEKELQSIKKLVFGDYQYYLIKILEQSEYFKNHYELSIIKYRF